MNRQVLSLQPEYNRYSPDCGCLFIELLGRLSKGMSVFAYMLLILSLSYDSIPLLFNKDERGKDALVFLTKYD